MCTKDLTIQSILEFQEMILVTTEHELKQVNGLICGCYHEVYHQYGEMIKL